jgi:hypothetical protein
MSHLTRARETREGRDDGGKGGEAHRGTGAERMDETTAVLGDESDGERRKKRRAADRAGRREKCVSWGEGDEQGRFH